MMIATFLNKAFKEPCRCRNDRRFIHHDQFIPNISLAENVVVCKRTAVKAALLYFICQLISFLKVFDNGGYQNPFFSADFSGGNLKSSTALFWAIIFSISSILRGAKAERSS